MALPVFGATRTSTDDNNVTSLNVLAVSGISVGDLLIMIVWINRNGNTDTFNTPAGWAKVGFVSGGTGVAVRPRCIVYSKIAVGGEGTELISWTSGTSKAMAFYTRWSGADEATPTEGFVDEDGNNVPQLLLPATASNAPDSIALAGCAAGAVNQDWTVQLGIGWDAGNVPTSQRGRSGTQGNQDNVTSSFTFKNVPNAGTTEDVTMAQGDASVAMAGFQVVISSGSEPAGGTLEIGDGVEFISGIPKVFDGVDFITTTPRIFDGVDFIP